MAQPNEHESQATSGQDTRFDALPTCDLSGLQCQWLRPARARMLRLAGISQAKSILELGCGWGEVAVELASRCNGDVMGIDHNPDAIEYAKRNLPSKLAGRLTFECADVARLPMPSSSFDIVFCQCSLLWMRNRGEVLREASRLLVPGGKLVAIEPDYGGLMEYPMIGEVRDLWITALQQCGADPFVGRQLLPECSAIGLRSEAYFFDRYEAFHRSALGFLRAITVSDEKLHSRFRQIKRQIDSRDDPNDFVIHLPYWMMVAEKPNEVL